jgi:MFS family permease
LGNLTVPVVLIAAFLAALGGVFYSPAASTLMIDIIPHDDMVRGRSLFSGSASLVNMLGSAFSGALIAFFGVPIIIIFNGLSNVYSAISELFVRVPKTVRQGESVTLRGVLRDSKDAVKTIFSEPCLRIFVPCALILNLLGAGPMSLLLPFTEEKGFSLENYGILMAVWTASSLVCVLLLGSIKLSPKTRFFTMAISFTSSVAFFIATYLSNNFLLTCVFAALAAFTNCAGNTVFSSSLMLALPEENRGAILGFSQSASIGGSAISTVVYGFLGDVFPLYLIFVIGNVISIIPMIYLCFNRRVKEFIISH